MDEILGGRERAEAFMAWSDTLVGRADSGHQLFGEGGSPSIAALWYAGYPWDGWGLGVSYGASLCGPQNIEFVTMVKSSDPAWGWAVAHFVDSRRSELGSVGAGDTINWHEPISGESRMNALVVVPPFSLPENQWVVHLGDEDHVQLLQVVPVHASEIEDFKSDESGFFDQLGDLALNPQRQPLDSRTGPAT